MRFNTNINNVKALEWDLNIQQAYLFAWIYELPSWAEKVTIGKETFYFAAKNKAITELPILTKKMDTMYRYYKQLQDKDLIEVRKIDGKDYIAITAKAKEWNGTKSDTSEINPNEVGNKSESDSEINPTYNITSKDNNTNYTKKEFVEDWNYLRTKHLNKPSFLPGLNREDEANFKELISYSDREQVRQGLVGLFRQKSWPNGNTQMASNPKHFLTHFNSYFSAYHDQNTNLYGEKKQEATL